jgi:uncharacterized protein
MPGVADSSTLIFYRRIGRLDILEGVYGTVIVPAAVEREVVQQGTQRPGSEGLRSVPWIELREPANPEAVRRYAANLGAGESEVLAIAEEIAESAVAILDDDRARRVARARGIPIRGSAGTLVRAKDLGLIPMVAPLLIRLEAAGMFLSDATRHEVLRLAGE